MDTGDVFFGNDIPPASAAPSTSPGTPTPRRRSDSLANNVQNVFLAPPLGTNYAVTVLGRGA